MSRPTLIIFIVLLQFALLAIPFASDGPYPGKAFEITRTIIEIAAIITVLWVVSSKSKPGFKILWIVIIMALPFFGCVLYLTFRFQESARRLDKRYRLIERPDKLLRVQDESTVNDVITAYPNASAACNYLSHTAGFPVYKNSDVRYFELGDTFYPTLLEELSRAEKFIFIELFILEEGIMWSGVSEILKRKAAEGVDVRIIYDDLGCMYKLPRRYNKKIEEMGIKCAVFNPFRPFITNIQNNRDHRKIIVIDGRLAFTGGVNIADEYINKVERFGHWKDTAVMISGDAVRSFTLFFLNMWAFIKRKNEDIAPFLTEEGHINNINCGFVQPYCDSPTDKENVAEHVYMQMITGAAKYLYICTPYLIIDDGMMSALTLAAKSGVDVRIITPHIPDKRIVHATTRSYYEPLTRAGVRIYEYTPGFIHAKVFVSDDIHAAIGSVNLDYRSLYLHFECGARLYGSDAILDIKRDFLSTLEMCEEITNEKCKKNIISKFDQIVMRLWAPFM